MEDNLAISTTILRNLEDKKCPICTCDFDSKSLIVTSCSHIFCQECLSSLKSPYCPLCRNNFTIVLGEVNGTAIKLMTN